MKEETVYWNTTRFIACPGCGKKIPEVLGTCWVCREIEMSRRKKDGVV
jgi:adenine-specific DNA methylase